MGIKHFWYYIRTHYANNNQEEIIKQHMSKQQQLNIPIDNLLIDMNGIFHTAAQQTFNYGNYKKIPSFLTKTYDRRSQKEKQADLYRNITNYIEDLLFITNTRKRVIMCVDGPAPLSKQNQQRQRRSKSAKEADVQDFDRNCITPGTVFMDYLSRYIDFYIKTQMSNPDSRWRNLEVVYSNDKSPGEGEHKLMNYLRKYANNNSQESYCLFGCDADLIMLGFSSHIKNFYILRNNNMDNSFDLINIDKLGDKLLDDLKWEPENNQLEIHAFNKKKAMNDFILLCFMVGNDFLPNIPSIEIIQDGIDLIIDTYKEICKKFGHITSYEIDQPTSVKFNPEILGMYLETIGKCEQSNLLKKARQKGTYYQDTILEACTFIEHKENAQSSGVVGLKVVDINVDADKYVQLYCDIHFPNESLEKISHSYLEGMQWILSYYTNGVSNWNWCYKYHHAPPASVIAKHIKTYKHVNYPKTYPSPPFLQLLAVMPPKSAKLLPRPLDSLLTSNESPLKPFCPDDFVIDLAGKRKEWEGIPILPMVDIDVLKSVYDRYIGFVDEQNARRNIHGKTFVYSYSQHNPETVHKSYYGTIYNCKVKISMIDI